MGHHILTTTINPATFPYAKAEPFLPLCLDCQSCNPATLRFCPVALTNLIQLFLYPCRKSSKTSLSWTITFVTLIFPLSPLIFSPLLWSEAEATRAAPPEPFPTSQSSELTQNQSPFSIFTLCTGCAKYKSHPVLSTPQNSPAPCSLWPHINSFCLSHIKSAPLQITQDLLVAMPQLINNLGAAGIEAGVLISHHKQVKHTWLWVRLPGTLVLTLKTKSSLPQLKRESLLLHPDYGTQVWGLTPNVCILTSSIEKEKKALFSNLTS